jgi:hypothetical protein
MPTNLESHTPYSAEHPYRVVIREKRDHPFDLEVPIYRAYELLEDGSEFNLRMAETDPEELKRRIVAGSQFAVFSEKF